MQEDNIGSNQKLARTKSAVETLGSICVSLRWLAIPLEFKQYIATGQLEREAIKPF